ncbi:hypothetical protein X759_28265 [Mesorhizobium sp. LSHC420B00]|uniref:ApeA N-terminal domain 1-containing protein n=1 Tax=unclassified Mesorhizobium TaxID=325217 RepID=UPI0003CE6D40|nr:HEPN domain-containing protein [Mesorhizobium sp. LSHC420B00]ESX66075.1 hypothetical protein X759_28265 [Mesorhizobium sp. LSHC420B00]
MPAPLGLRDSFTEEGFWWLAGKEADPIAGTLTFSPTDGATLSLLGFVRDSASPFRSFVDNDDERATIYGTTKKGKPVTLLRPINKSRQINMPGIPNETWTSSLCVVGIHLEDDDKDQVFSRSYLRFESIEQWLQSKPFTTTVDQDSRVLTVSGNPSREEHFASHQDFELTSVGSLFSSNEPATHFTIDVFSQLALIPQAPQSLNWHMSRAMRIQGLASLCMGHYLPLHSLELRGPVDDLGNGFKKPRDVHVYAQLTHPEAGHRPAHEPPLISGPELIAINPGAVQLWFDQYELFDPAIALFFTISSQRQMFTNVRLLLAIQALEVFHRRTSDSSLMPESDFAKFAKALTDAIPPSANTAMKERLKASYQFVNEPSLGQRLRSIAGDLASALGTPPPAFHKGYLRKLVDTRNYYTHFSATLKDKALDGAGMHWASRRVVLLLTFLFLQRLGIAAKSIVPLLERHREFSQLWATAENPRF